MTNARLKDTGGGAQKQPLSIGFNVPFNEAIDAAKARDVVLPDVYYDELQAIARQKAFSIAGLASLDQLQAVKDSLDKAIASGQSFNAWKKQMITTGTLDLPRHRLDNIFRTNLQGQYMAGKWEKFRVTAHDRPFLMYDAINDTRTRPAHLALNGIIRPIDDPFWQTHSPMCGYRCRCSLRTLSDSQARARSQGEDKGLNKQATLPNGDPANPDAGWDYDKRGRMEGIKRATQEKKAKADKPLVVALEARVEKNSNMNDRAYLKAEGAKLLDEILSSHQTPKEQHAELVRRLRENVATDTPAKANYLGSEAKTAKRWFENATKLLPASWIKACDNFGNLNVRASKRESGRGFQKTIEEQYIGRRVKLPEFKIVEINAKNEGFIFLDNSAESCAIHEYCHRVQEALPELDAIFQAEHRARTAGDNLQRLRDVTGLPYGPDELTRQDHYIRAYFGREYAGRGALEVMSMSIEAVLGVFDNDPTTLRRFKQIMQEDRDLANLVVGILLRWEP